MRVCVRARGGARGLGRMSCVCCLLQVLPLCFVVCVGMCLCLLYVFSTMIVDTGVTAILFFFTIFAATGVTTIRPTGDQSW